VTSHPLSCLALFRKLHFNEDLPNVVVRMKFEVGVIGSDG
jgi:hypothetical protein